MKQLPVRRFKSTAALTTFIHIDAVIGLPAISTAATQAPVRILTRHFVKILPSEATSNKERPR
jgi:hypothetical protein